MSGANGGQSFPGRGHVYDVAIVGAGPSGCEVAYACTAAGLDTLLVTTSMDTMYNLIGDGWHLDPPAGTLMESLCREVADEGGFVATWALHRAAKQALERRERLHVLQSNVSALHVREGRVEGLATWEGVDRFAERVVLAVGSFLAPELRIGRVTEMAGKLSEMAYADLYEDLKRHGFRFREVELSTSPEDGSLPYTVRCHVFDPAEADRHRTTRLAGLYAVGLCLHGEITFEETASDGLALGRELAAARE